MTAVAPAGTTVRRPPGLGRRARRDCAPNHSGSAQWRRIGCVAILLLGFGQAFAMQGGASPARLREVVVGIPALAVRFTDECRSVIRTLTRPDETEAREELTYCKGEDGRWGAQPPSGTAARIASASAEQVSDLLIVRDGETIAAKRGMALYAGTTLVTGEMVAFLTFEDARVEVQVFPNTQVDVLNPSIRATLGGLYVRIRERLREAFRVVSDYGVAGAEGTQFAVFAGPDRNTFEVYQGRVSVQPAIPGATPLAIEAGYGALLERAAQPQVYPLPEHRIRAVLGNVRAADAAAVLDYEPIPLADPRRAPAPADPAAVREAQHWLQVLGYDPGPETGELNERTVAAIRRFQSHTGHPGAPVVDDALLEALAAEWKKRTEVIRDRAQPEGQTPGLPTPPEGKSYPPGYLTLDQIRRCAIDRISLDREKLAVDDELRQLNAAIESLNEQTAELQRQHAALENTDEAAVDAFNERVEAHRARMRRLEEGPQHAYDQHVAEWNGAQDEINERCIDKRVWRDDVDQVKRELGLKRFPFKVVSGS